LDGVRGEQGVIAQAHRGWRSWTTGMRRDRRSCGRAPG
jgi:hypothetical protein